MTTSCNPIYYLKHAWENTNSKWGQAAIVLFYAFVWFQILWAVQILIVPLAGYDCYVDKVEDYDILTVKAYLRMLNIFTVGFFLYADRGGIRLWNVAMVFVVYLLWSIVTYNYAVAMADVEKFAACSAVMAAMKKTVWITLAWAAVALGCSYMDSVADSTPSSETIPLTA